MTSRKLLPVNIPNVSWYDGQQVTEDELQDDQNRHISIDAANVNNLMGSGAVRKNPVPVVLIDTNSLNTQQQTLFDGYSFDGQDVYIGSPLNEISDQVYGVHLSVTMQGVRLSGAASSKVSIIGDTFGDTMVHDDLLFNENGTQVTRNRYKSIRGIMFNDFAGNLNGSESYALVADSYEFVGRCVIQEAEVMEVSSDHIVASQVKQPNQFYGNFSPYSYTRTVNYLLQETIGSDKSISDMDIAFDSMDQRQLAVNDVTTRIGQKFQASGTNIQKVSVLLSVAYDNTAPPGDAYNWSGSIVMNLHALQTDVDCPVTPVPDDAIDFDPDPAIIAQLTLDASNFEEQGVVLDGYPKTVDFVFTGATISDPVRSAIEEDRFYVFTLGRSGDAHTGTIVLEEASDRIDNSYMVYFDGSEWVNITDSDMWFSVEGDYVKVSDGIAYEDGIGLQIPEVEADATNTEVPYVEGLVTYYTSTYDAYNYLITEASDNFSDPEQDQRTGNQVYSRVTPKPTFSMLSQTNFDTLLVTDPAPLVLARAKDLNPRGNPDSITGVSAYIGLTTGNEFNILWPDADIRTFNLVRSMLVPNTTNSAKYRIIETTLYNDAYGDVDGNGEVSISDQNAVSTWVSKWGPYVVPVGQLSLSDSYLQGIIADGYLDTLEFLRADVNGDGIVSTVDASLIQDFVDKTITTFSAGESFSRMNLIVENLTNPLTTDVDIPDTDSSFETVPYNELTWRVDYSSSWIPDLLDIEDLRRDMPTTFIEPSSTTSPGGKNNFFMPANFMLDGYILNPDSTFYSVDFEMTHLSLDIPIIDSDGNPTFLDGYSGILLFDNFVAESSSGLTSSGFAAMKYADGTYVQIGDFTDGKVKISASIQSTASSFGTPFGGSINDIVGLYYDPATSLVTLYINNLYDDGYGNVLTPASTKLLVSVYLKKAGFRNSTTEITQGQIRALLGI